METIKGWETKTMARLFRLTRPKNQSWVDYHARTFLIARKIWVQMGLPFLCEKIAESMWRAMGWVCDEKSNVVIFFLKKVGGWWHSSQTMMKEAPENRTRWEHKWGWHNRGNVWDKMASRWAGEKYWMRVRKKKNTPEQ